MSDPHIINNTIYDGQAILELIEKIKKATRQGYRTNGPIKELKIRYINAKRKSDRWSNFGPYFAWVGWNQGHGAIELGIVRRGGVGGNALMWLAESADSDELHLPREVVRDICRVIYRKFDRSWVEDGAVDVSLQGVLPEWPTILMNDKAAGRKEYSLQKAKSEVVKCEATLAKSMKLVSRAKRSLNRHENAYKGAQKKLVEAKEKVETAESTLAKSKETVKKRAEALDEGK